MLFADKAFAAPSLTSPDKLSQLTIPSGLNQLPLPLRDELRDIPIFRDSTRNLYGHDVSHKKLQYQTVYTWMTNLGRITGFQQVARPYTLRYGAGNAFDASGKLSIAQVLS